MVRAVEKLRESFSKPLRIEDVARELGYDDASHFNREYKRHFGQPPDARRRTTARARDGVYPGSAPPLLQQRLRVVIVWIELERALGGAHGVFSLAGLLVDVRARRVDVVGVRKELQLEVEQGQRIGPAPRVDQPRRGVQGKPWTTSKGQIGLLKRAACCRDRRRRAIAHREREQGARDRRLRDVIVPATLTGDVPHEPVRGLCSEI